MTERGAETTTRVLLAGNPNCGKSSLFNALTGLRQKTGNFPGVTVEKHSGKLVLPGAKSVNLVDLPGTYSLFPKSPDEAVSVKEIQVAGSNKEIVLLVADSLHLKRSLYLASQCIDLGIRVIVLLNFSDMARQRNLHINVPALSEKMDVPVLSVSAYTGEGLDKVKQLLAEVMDGRDLKPSKEFISSLYIGDKQYNFKELTDSSHVSETNRVKVQTEEAVLRYKIIDGWLKDIINRQADNIHSLSRKIDKWLTHKVWGYIVFLCILFLIFQFIFKLSAYPMDWIEQGFMITGNGLSALLPAGVLNDLICKGIWAGLGGILVFIPQIALLFGFICLLEDSGYMARVSFIMDRLMMRFGMNGRSLIPLMSGVACAVPAIMGARTIQNRKERLITILVTPFMSCSARLPVYTLLLSFIFPAEKNGSFFQMAGLILMALYGLGFCVALLAGAVLNKGIKDSERSYFLLEMPAYRLPRLRNVLLTMLEKVKVFVWDAGRIILAIAVVMWALSSYGPGDAFKKAKEKESYLSSQNDINDHDLAIAQSEVLYHSYAGYLGKMIEPVIKPLGFDWKIGISLITSFAAREVFVGTMATIYSVGDPDDMKTLRERMKDERDLQSGKPVFTLATNVSLILFYAFALQCMSTIAVVVREGGSRRLALFQFLGMGFLAWISAFAAKVILS